MDVDEKNVGNAEDENIKHEEIYIKEETLNDDETNKIDNYTNKIDGQDGKVSRRKRRAVKEIMKEEPYSSEDDEIMETIKQVSHRKRRAVKQIIKGELYSSEDDEIIENTEQGFGLKDEIDHDIVKEELSYSSHEEDNVKSRRKISDSEVENRNSTLNSEGDTTAMATPAAGGSRRSKTNKRKKEDSSDVVLQLIADTLKNEKQTSANQSFGSYIAQQLDELGDKKMVSIAKKIFSELIFEAQMGTLTPNTTVCNIQTSHPYRVTPGPSSSSSYSAIAYNSPDGMSMDARVDVGDEQSTTNTIMTATDFINNFTCL